MQSAEFTLTKGPNAGQKRPAVVIGEEDGKEYLAVFTLPSDKMGVQGIVRIARETQGHAPKTAGAESKPKTTKKATPSPTTKKSGGS